MFTRQPPDKKQRKVKVQAVPRPVPVAQAEGDRTMPKVANVSEEFIRQCYEQYKAGTPLADIEMPCSVETMRSRFKSLGLVYPIALAGDDGRGHRAKYTRDDFAAWQKLRDGGMSARAIAARFGVSTSTVSTNTAAPPASTPAAAPVKAVPKKARKSDRLPRPSRAEKITDAVVREFYDRYAAGESLKTMELPCAIQTMINRFRDLRLAFPLVTSSRRQATEPEKPEDTAPAFVPLITATSPDPELGRQRARELHDQAGRVVAVHDLPSVFARQRPYEKPHVSGFGSLADNPILAARMAEKLVNELNRVPGVTASFRFSFSLEVGA